MATEEGGMGAKTKVVSITQTIFEIGSCDQAEGGRKAGGLPQLSEGG